MQPRRHEDTKKTFFLCLHVFVVAFAVVASAGTSAVARRLQPSVGDAANGKQLFMTYYCYSCHGTEGQGGAVRGSSRARPPIH